MKHFRYSLRALFGLIAFVAVGCAALINASDLWSSLALTVTVLVLMVAVVGGICRAGPERAYWIGFAVFGWIYLLLVFFSIMGLGRHLATIRLTVLTYTKLLLLVRTPPPSPPPMASWYAAPMPYRATPPAVSSPPVAQPYPSGPPVIYAPRPAQNVSCPSQNQFVLIGDSLWACLFALLGGFVARYFHATREKPP